MFELGHNQTLQKGRLRLKIMLFFPCLSLSQGDHTWATMLGQSVRLQPVSIQSLSELERARLQEVALYHLERRDLDFKISIPRGIFLKCFAY